MAPATVRKAPYKDFLQPALHRRFTTTASILLGIAYLQSISIGSWNSLFWTWFPIGPAGIRALFIFLCVLLVIILRIAQYHVGLRTSESAFQTFTQHALKMQTAEALVAYVPSALLFSLIYRWSLPEDSGLELITSLTADRARLNEHTVFFTTHFVILGVVQALVHLFRDNDRLSLGVAKAQNAGAEDPASQWKRFWDQIPAIVIATLNQSLAGIVISVVVYPLLLRASIWRGLVFFLRPVFNLPRSNTVPASLPFSWRSLGRCWLASYMLLFMWITGNAAFSIFLVREPLKNGKPLTSESKDPNGSLLNGLKSKKLHIKCFAMWELAFIARDYEVRRKAIYEDIDRKDGPMWSQVYAICIETLKAMETRIDWGHGKPPPPDPAASAKAAPPVEEKKRTMPPLKDEPIFDKTPVKKNYLDKAEEAYRKTLAPGQGSQVSPLAKKAVNTAKDGLVKIQKEVTGSDDTQALLKSLCLRVLKSPVGWPWRKEYNRRLNTVVLGTPYGEPSLYINAIYALAQLAVHSLKEDKYGNVQRDVASIIKTLTTITKKLEKFKTSLETHWTDVEAKRESPEVDQILEALRDALSQLIQEFGPYARDLKLTLSDMRLAREAAGIPNP
ncbi:nucleoporin NDC1 [Diplogelasinospora grovesii]|uniref:Nucleoporin NDC1 n=1 Tax=Diplogelasinospora grovesii TaxID=303347 RepID=A0AAN6SB31_9PEZI|nr:nucleoporin NDC1 [Diplogelasinospora grovesii]